MIDTGLDIIFDERMHRFIYPPIVFGPKKAEQRYLKDILHSMLDHKAKGPEIVYSIAMDIGLKKNHTDLLERGLLFGIVAYAKGSIGEEPIKSQGHVHSISKTCQMSTPEVYEIWSGEAIIYMQERSTNNPGVCYAVYAKAGEIVIVPPGWAHCTINASKEKNMIFGAWCVRDFGFDYTDIKAHNGLAFYPKFDTQNVIIWEKNPSYQVEDIIKKTPREYSEFLIKSNISIYRQYEQEKTKFDFVVRPDQYKEKWLDFIP